jgi:hypothetical protein
MTNEEIKFRARVLAKDLEKTKLDIFTKISEAIDLKDMIILAEMHGRAVTLVGQVPEKPFESEVSITFRVRDITEPPKERKKKEENLPFDDSNNEEGE